MRVNQNLYSKTYNSVLLSGHLSAKNYVIFKILNLETVTIPNFGDFESYPNRNSLHYKEKYNLEGIQSLVRGTMRKKGFSSAWDFLVENGLTNYGESEKMFKMRSISQAVHITVCAF